MAGRTLPDIGSPFELARLPGGRYGLMPAALNDLPSKLQPEVSTDSEMFTSNTDPLEVVGPPEALKPISWRFQRKRRIRSILLHRGNSSLRSTEDGWALSYVQNRARGDVWLEPPWLVPLLQRRKRVWLDRLAYYQGVQGHDWAVEGVKPYVYYKVLSLPEFVLGRDEDCRWPYRDLRVWPLIERLTGAENKGLYVEKVAAAILIARLDSRFRARGIVGSGPPSFDTTPTLDDVHEEVGLVVLAFTYLNAKVCGMDPSLFQSALAQIARAGAIWITSLPKQVAGPLETLRGACRGVLNSWQRVGWALDAQRAITFAYFGVAECHSPDDKISFLLRRAASALSRYEGFDVDNLPRKTDLVKKAVRSYREGYLEVQYPAKKVPRGANPYSFRVFGVVDFMETTNVVDYLQRRNLFAEVWPFIRTSVNSGWRLKSIMGDGGAGEVIRLVRRGRFGDQLAECRFRGATVYALENLTNIPHVFGCYTVGDCPLCHNGQGCNSTERPRIETCPNFPFTVNMM